MKEKELKLIIPDWECGDDDKRQLLSYKKKTNNMTAINLFECSVKYEKTMANGMVKKVSEPYLVDALSFTEAEKRFIEEIQPFMSGEFEVKTVKRANYSEIVPSDSSEDDRWYKVRMAYITLDEKSGLEKKASTYMLVQASDLRTAVKNVDQYMEGSMADYEIQSVSETAIMDVFFYDYNQD